MVPPRDDLSLGFVNTRYWRGRVAPTETLAAPADLAAWWQGESGEALAPPDAACLLAARDLREMLHRIFAARAEARRPEAADLAAFNDALASAPARQRLDWQADGLVWSGPPSWAGVRAALLWSAAELLTGARRDRVRQCDNPECRYLFLDASKAGTRRWCDMSSCGNRAKAHRHYRRRVESKKDVLF